METASQGGHLAPRWMPGRRLVSAMGAAAGVALTGALLSGTMPPWARIPAALVTSGLLAAAAVALAWRIQRRRRDAGRCGAAIVHALCALATTALGTALVWASVRAAEPQAMDAFVRGPVYWCVAWWLLVYALAATLGHAVRTRERLRARELAAARAELHALRAQLDPHFLFNTLHSLSVLVREDRELAEDALERFGEMMRYVLRTSRAGEDVTLADELAFVRDYLALEKLRLGERLRVIEDVDDDALDCVLPALVVQPLVENAVRHGIAPRARGGTIAVHARTDGDALLLSVRDDGAGAAAGAAARGAGLGLEAVRRQLVARFPAEHELAVHAPPEGGFAVQIRVPADRASVHAAPRTQRRAS